MVSATPISLYNSTNLPLTQNDLLNALNTLVMAINTPVSVLVGSGLTATANTADTNDDILQTFVIPANYFTAPGQTVRLTASGVTASNGNNKTIKFKVGSTVLMQSGTLTTNNGSWRMQLDIVHLAANSQMVSGQGISGTTVWANSAAQTLTETAAITVTVTGASPTTGAASDVTCNALYVEFIK